MVWPCTHARWITRAYIKAVREKSLISSWSFSLFSSSQRKMLSSLSWVFIFFDWEELWSEVVARWPTTVGGGAAAANPSFLYLFASFYSFFLPLSDSTLQIPKSYPYIPRSRKEQNKRKRYYLCVVWTVWCWWRRSLSVIRRPFLVCWSDSAAALLGPLVDFGSVVVRVGWVRGVRVWCRVWLFCETCYCCEFMRLISGCFAGFSCAIFGPGSRVLKLVFCRWISALNSRSPFVCVQVQVL